MQVIAIVAAAAVAPGEVGALGAGADVVLVQEVALVAFFAEALEPVLAHEVVRAVRDGVFVWAEGAERAVAFAEGFAVGLAGGDAEAVFFSEEGGEGEGGVRRGGVGGGVWGCRWAG